MTGDIFMSTCKLFLFLTLNFFVSNYLARFVNRDMYMRYAGGGVGHYKVDLKEGSRDSAPPPEPEPAAEDAFDDTETPDNHGDANFQTVDEALTNLLGTAADDNADGRDFAESDSSGDSDYEDLEFESEGGSASEDYEEENFGVEDGEGVFGDIEDEEGYAPL